MICKKLYNSVFSQTFSPCRRYLICGNVFGDISIFNVEKLLSSPDNNSPEHTFNVSEDPICSLSSSDNHLIAGTSNTIYSWDWDSIKALKPKSSFLIEMPKEQRMHGDQLEKLNVNSIKVKNDTIYASCGNFVYAFSLENGSLKRKYTGHEDYIHSIAVSQEQVASASEDGSVRFWDSRKGSLTNIIRPNDEVKCTRPNLGKWVGDVDLTQDWMVCGGGPCLSLWNLRTLDIMTSYNQMTDRGIHVALLEDGCVLGGGCENNFYQLSYTGEIMSKIQSSASTIFSAVYTNTPTEVLSLAGAGNNIDICENFIYANQRICFYK